VAKIQEKRGMQQLSRPDLTSGSKVIVANPGAVVGLIVDMEDVINELLGQ
jgi:hypothetical protein